MYLTVEEILKSVKSLGISKNLSEENIQIMIDDETAIINGHLSHRYVLPIEKDNPKTENAFNIVKAAVRYRVMVRLEMFLNLKGDVKTSQAILPVMKTSTISRDTLKKIVEGKINLDGVPIVHNYISSNFRPSRFSDDRPNW